MKNPRPKVLFFSGLLCLISATATCRSVNAPTSLIKTRFQEALDSLRTQYRFPGATAAYILPDGTMGTAATGLSDMELKILMTPESRMLAASIGKTFVGATVLALAMEGVLTINDPISKWLGDRSWFARLPHHEAITLRQLLNHSSGIANHVEEERFREHFRDSSMSLTEPLSPEDLIGFVLERPALFAPGRGWAYSDTGYILVGLIIEAATGQDFYEQVTRRFLKPLQLSLTSPSDRPDLPGLAAGYTSPGNPFGLPAKTTLRPGVMAWHPGIEWAGGGFISNPKDLVVWAKALFEGKAMTGSYLDELLRSVPISPEDPGNRYGIAVSIRNEGTPAPSWGHGGWIPGYCSSLRYYPNRGMAVAFQINTDIGVIDHSTPLIADMENRLASVVIETVWK